MTEPGFWMDEQSGVLAPVVEKWLSRLELDDRELGTMRAYLRQWIAAPGFVGSQVERLRDEVDDITSNTALRVWLSDAADVGIDPF